MCSVKEKQYGIYPYRQDQTPIKLICLSMWNYSDGKCCIVNTKMWDLTRSGGWGGSPRGPRSGCDQRAGVSLLGRKSKKINLKPRCYDMGSLGHKLGPDGSWCRSKIRGWGLGGAGVAAPHRSQARQGLWDTGSASLPGCLTTGGVKATQGRQSTVHDRGLQVWVFSD